MNPIATQEVNPGVYAIRDDFTNMFLIKEGDRFIPIDACGDLKNVKKGIADLRIAPESIGAVFLTHSDPD